MIWEPVRGETPVDDISGLKVRAVNPTRAQISQYEGMNIALAEEKYFGRRLTKARAAFDLPWTKKLHREMFGDVWDWAGEFRTIGTNIGSKPVQIQMHLIQLLDDLHAWPGLGMRWEEQAARLHHRAVQIHPFVNGNGRWARMLANIWLRRNFQPLTLWPVTVDKESPIRGQYLDAVKRADDMDYGPLIALHEQYQEA